MEPSLDERLMPARLVETAIGWIAIGWRGAAVSRVALPELDGAPARSFSNIARYRAGDGAAPGPIHHLADLLKTYAKGGKVDFAEIAIDLSDVDPFRREIYAAARAIGFGRTCTYGRLAANAGHAGKARETGRALGLNPFPIVVPCHRVLAAGKGFGGFSAPGGLESKLRLLRLEGVSAAGQASLGF